MSFLLLSHAALGLLGALLINYFGTSLDAVSFAAGAAVALLNLIGLVIAWPRILAKKLVALSIGVIVFKFAILAWIINVVATGDRLNVGWFAGGLALVVVSVMATAVKVTDESPEQPIHENDDQATDQHLGLPQDRQQIKGL